MLVVTSSIPSFRYDEGESKEMILNKACAFLVVPLSGIYFGGGGRESREMIRNKSNGSLISNRAAKETIFAIYLVDNKRIF